MPGFVLVRLWVEVEQSLATDSRFYVAILSFSHLNMSFLEPK